ncbi:hypothetical protein A6A05_04345 [Magnetospirillum moscoviense]|uniref:Uncharacterized protein n=2 Tax=Magnetospirillum moscoviense TaxID=1437059 RepID=A0A178MB86_9PROT|nr:hypothetical protein A6A05_04345 [Magnetospirillum moscoviense]
MIAHSVMTFPISRGLEGLNRLTTYLNALPLAGDWHFSHGTRFDQTEVAIDFELSADLDLVRSSPGLA